MKNIIMEFEKIESIENYNKIYNEQGKWHTYQSWEYGEAKKTEGIFPTRYRINHNNKTAYFQILDRNIINLRFGYIQHGPVGMDKWSKEELLLFLDKFQSFVKGKYAAVFVQFPLSIKPDIISNNYTTSKTKIAYNTTIMIDINKDIETILGDFSKTTRYEVKRSLKEDIITIEYGMGTEAIERFLTLAQVSSIRSGGSYPSYDYYKKMSMNNNLVFFFAICNNKVISAISSYVSKNVIIYQWAAMTNLREYTKVFAQKRLVYEMIIWAKERKIKYLDFGGISLEPPKGSKIEGIKRFKSSFGGKIYSGRTFVISSFPKISKAILSLFSWYRVEFSNSIKSFIKK